jgi:hypothetical protein
MIDKTSKNEIEMIVWELTSFLIDECRNFSIEMMNHCKYFLMMIEKFSIDEINDCTNFAIFLKFLIKKFLELLIEMKIKMKMIVSKNFLLWTIREVNVSLMIVEMIVLLLIVLEVMILDVQMTVEIQMILEVMNEMIFFVIQISIKLVKNNLVNFVQSQSLINEQFYLIETSRLVNSLFSSLFKTFLSHFLTSHAVISRSVFSSVSIFIRRVYVKSCVILSEHQLMLLWNLVLFILRSHLETWLTDLCLVDCIIFISWSSVQCTHLLVQNSSFSEMMRMMSKIMSVTMKMKMTTRRNLVDWWEERKQMLFWVWWLAESRLLAEISRWFLNWTRTARQREWADFDEILDLSKRRSRLHKCSDRFVVVILDSTTSKTLTLLQTTRVFEWYQTEF